MNKQTIASIKLTAQNGNSLELYSLTGEAKGEIVYDQTTQTATVNFNFNGEIGGFDVNQKSYRRNEIESFLNHYFGEFSITVVKSSESDAATNERSESGRIEPNSESNL